MVRNNSPASKTKERRREQNKLAQRRFRRRYRQRKATGPQGLLSLSLSPEPQGRASSRPGDDHHHYHYSTLPNTPMLTTNARTVHTFDCRKQTSPLERGGVGASAHILPDYFDLSNPDDYFFSDLETTLHIPDFFLPPVPATANTDPATPHAVNPYLHNAAPTLAPEKSTSSSHSSSAGVSGGYWNTAVSSGGLNADTRCPRLSPLQHAVQRGQDRIVQILLAHQANCNEQDGEGRTALVHAVVGGYDEVVDLLLLHGARIGIVDNELRSALHWAVLNRRDRLLKRLLQYCAGESAVIDGMTREWKTPLLLAIETGSEAAVEVLLKAGADVHCQEPGDKNSTLR